MTIEREVGFAYCDGKNGYWIERGGIYITSAISSKIENLTPKKLTLKQILYGMHKKLYFRFDKDSFKKFIAYLEDFSDGHIKKNKFIMKDYTTGEDIEEFLINIYYPIENPDKTISHNN